MPSFWPFSLTKPSLWLFNQKQLYFFLPENQNKKVLPLFVVLFFPIAQKRNWKEGASVEDGRMALGKEGIGVEFFPGTAHQTLSTLHYIGLEPG